MHLKRQNYPKTKKIILKSIKNKNVMNVDELLEHDCFKNLKYRVGTDKNHDIKVIGIGNGGGNAVNNLYYENVSGATLVICDTNDRKLQSSPVATQILLRTPHFEEVDVPKYNEEEQNLIKQYYKLTNGKPGLGAGNSPIIAQLAAESTLSEIKNLLKDSTKMVFLTASMGGGTGSGAAAVIAEACQEFDILTVGIVTLPFEWEGKPKMRQAWEGVEKMVPFVDALLIILNDNLLNENILEKYREQLSTAEDGTIEPAADELFKLADNVLADAVKSVVELVERTGYIDLDFADINTALKGGGGTIMDSGYATGNRRFYKAMKNALDSPLLHNIDISKATKIILAVFSSRDAKFTKKEFDEIKEFSKNFADEYWFKLGMYYDDTLGAKAKVTIIATGSEDENIIPPELRIMFSNQKGIDISPLKIFDDQKELTKYQNNTAYSRIL